jgi:hypothetical protein
MLSKYQSGRESLVKARKSWYTELESVLFEESRVTYGLTEPDIPSHKALTYINKSKDKNEENKRKRCLNWEDIVCGLSTVFQDSLRRNNMNHALMRSSNSSQVEDLSTNGSINVVWAENGRVRRKFGHAEDMFSRASNHSQDRNDKDSTGANEPDKEIRSKLLSPNYAQHR